MDAGPEVVAPLPPVPLVEGLGVSEIALYQTVKISVAKDGMEVVPYNAPLITDRKGLARVFMSVLNKRFKARFLSATLHIVPQSGPEITIDDSETLATSSEIDMATTFNFKYDATAIAFGTTIWVEVRDPKAMDAPIRFPSTGTLPLNVSKNPGRVRARLVPVKYMADNSGRLPDTSPTMVDRIKTQLMDMYPTNLVEIDVRDPPVDGLMIVEPGGKGWVELLQAIVDARAQDMPPSDIYYVGMFQPKSSFFQYCQGGCIVGLATTADPAIPAERAVLSVGWSNNSTAETIAHELGHVMGRHHAPCGGTQGVDQKFPYPSGDTGVPGWRQSDGAFLFESNDIMGYCSPFWISDYTYKALAARINGVNSFGFVPGGGGLTQTQHDVQRILIAPDGTLAVGKSLRMSEIIGGNDVTVIYRSGRGIVATAHGLRYGYDHLPGGFVLVMDPPNVAFTTVELK